MCPHNSQTIDHLLIDCQSASNPWSRLFAVVNLSGSMPKNFHELVWQWNAFDLHKKVMNVWLAGLHVDCWTLWLEME